MAHIRIMKELKVLKESKEMYVDVDDENMKNFKVMFFGPPDSVYHKGVFVFEFNIPERYPFDVPKVKFITGGLVKGRMHPNLYQDGKVCLSILNTWGNNEWSPLLTFEKIIVTIKGLLDNNPMAHEPPYERTDPHYNAYASYYTLKSIIDTYRFYTETNHPFGEIILEMIKNHVSEIRNQLEIMSLHHNKSYQTIHHFEKMNVESLKKWFDDLL